jgi:hypothetical protein
MNLAYNRNLTPNQVRDKKVNYIGDLDEDEDEFVDLGEYLAKQNINK